MVSAACTSPTNGPRVTLLTLGCARNEVDSEELAARLHAGGWQVSTEGEGADVVLVNTCGFVEKAKRDSIQTLLDAADSGAKVVAAGCLAERYGRELAEDLPEAQAVLGFDDYPEIAARLGAVLAGERLHPHTPQDRRRLLPLAPVARRGSDVVVPGHATVDEHTPAHLRAVLRHRLATGPVASLKLASGCDRRCAFCAIPAFRGAFVSRDPQDLLAEAEWLAGTGVYRFVRPVVEDQSVFCLTAHEGVVYGGASITGGLSTTEYTRESGAVFAWDMQAGEKLWELEPVPTERSVSAVAIGPDNRLWGLAGHTLFAVDLGSQQVVRQYRLGSRSAAGSIVISRERLYVSVDNALIYRVDPYAEDDEPALVVGFVHRRLCVHSDGSFSLNRGPELFRVVPRY